jgi:hypothetical protein
MNLISPELQRLEVLQAFKRRMPRTDAAGNISPFDDRITTAQGKVTDNDLPQIHAEVRQRIKDTLEAVRDGTRKSQVILLAGDAGTGKTHLLRTFQSSELEEQIGYIRVGGSNHWTINEFQARLLDWMIEALAAPSPAQEHLLLDRIRAIGFRAVDHLMASPVSWRQCLVRPTGRWFERLRGWLRAPSYDTQKQLAIARDPAVFRALDFTRFSEYVCDRFLAEKSNLTHRYALRVLLMYLFSDREETGVGTRERVLHWFRGRADNSYFTRRLGASERLDRQFGIFEAVKLLVHFFSPVVSQKLSTEEHPCPPRVLLLVFDQAEGRNELFDSDQDWMDFFAHLSELYNTLPNVVVLFTMSLGLRNHLHSLMERQFRDRIRMDEKFTLRLPDEGQILALYRSRLERWLQSDPILLDRYRELDNPYLPFDREQVLQIAGQQTIRDTLGKFDKAFHQTMRDLAVEAEFDFHFYLNELKPLELLQNEFEYTADHLDRVQDLLSRTEPWLPAEYGMTVEVEKVPDASPAMLALRFTDSANASVWACAYLAKLTFKNVQNQVNEAIEALVYKRRARYMLWLLRAGEIKAKPDPKKVDQIFSAITSSALESRLRALTHLAAKQTDYEKADHWIEARRFIRREFDQTYLGEVFREARKRLDGLLADPLSDGTEESSTAES